MPWFTSGPRQYRLVIALALTILGYVVIRARLLVGSYRWSIVAILLFVLIIAILIALGIRRRRGGYDEEAAVEFVLEEVRRNYPTLDRKVVAVILDSEWQWQYDNAPRGVAELSLCQQLMNGS